MSSDEGHPDGQDIVFAVAETVSVAAHDAVDGLDLGDEGRGCGCGVLPCR